MVRILYRGRRAFSIENEDLRVTVLEEGGHLAELFDKRRGINPLWTPPWPSIEPSAFEPERHAPVYGAGAEARLLAGIMGHNVCLDFFGPPSEEEAAAGLTVHGEGPIVPYAGELSDESLTLRAELPEARLHFTRELRLVGRAVRIRETVENLASTDRPIGWTQHVTIGPPFLEPGVTRVYASATQSRVAEDPFGDDGYLEPGATFAWPMAPGRDGGVIDLQPFSARARSSAYTTHLMDAARPHAWFVAHSRTFHLSLGYIWRRADFPWLGLWEENRSRQAPPWNGCTLTRGLEFGVSPFPETRRDMIARRELFGTPGYRWIPARTCVSVEYWAVLADGEPGPLTWPGDHE